MTDTAKYTEKFAHQMRGSGVRVAVAESLTSGALASALGATQQSSDWFMGGVVAYADEVKFSVLGVKKGDVVSRECAAQMAEGVAKLTGAEMGIAVTGVGGPAAENGHPAGTVFIAVSVKGDTVVEQRLFPGTPENVLAATVTAAITLAQHTIAPQPVADKPTSGMPSYYSMERVG